jgi:hypothetical protein
MLAWYHSAPSVCTLLTGLQSQYSLDECKRRLLMGPRAPSSAMLLMLRILGGIWVVVGVGLSTPDLSLTTTALWGGVYRKGFTARTLP